MLLSPVAAAAGRSQVLTFQIVFAQGAPVSDSNMKYLWQSFAHGRLTARGTWLEK